MPHCNDPLPGNAGFFKVKVQFSLCFFLTEHHAMKAYRGSGIIALRPGCFTLMERAPSTHWIGGWVGARAVLRREYQITEDCRTFLMKWKATLCRGQCTVVPTCINIHVSWILSLAVLFPHLAPRSLNDLLNLLPTFSVTGYRSRQRKSSAVCIIACWTAVTCEEKCMRTQGTEHPWILLITIP
jgi:hypothetical protein